MKVVVWNGSGDIALCAAPSQAAQWAATYPIGEVMNCNHTVKAGNCPHRAPMPRIIDLIAFGRLDAGRAVTTQEGMTGAVEAYETFDRHEPGWTTVVVDPAA